MLTTSVESPLGLFMQFRPIISTDTHVSKTMTNFLLLSSTITSVFLLATCSKNTQIMVMTTEAIEPKSDSKMTTKSMIETSVNDKKNMDTELIVAMTICNETFRTEMSYLISLNESGSFPDETDKTPKCFLRCVLQSLEVASTDDGKINPERAAQIFPDERDGKDVVETATICAQRDEKDHCEMAYNFLKCLFSMEIEKYSEKSP